VTRRTNLLPFAPVGAMLFLLSAPQLPAQTGRARIAQPVDSRRVVTLAHNTHPWARAEFDRGAAPADLPMERMLLVLRRSPEQESALADLLDRQQDAGSPEYHRWLTPAEFGARFGPSDEDIQTVRAWLEAQGFHVEPVTGGRAAIEFSGTAGQVGRAFHTSIHRYAVAGEEHWANASDPQIPEALAPVVAGVATLHNFHARPQSRIAAGALEGHSWQPQTDMSGGGHALSPADYAVIYNINPLYQAGIAGAGTTIAVVGRSNINVQDVQDFRNAFGLPNNPPQVVLNGPDPGIVSQGEEAEALLDVTWSGAVARNATIKLVVSQSTNTADGADLSEMYAIDHNVGDVLTESFGACEASVTAAQAALIASLAQQAAAQGITYLVSAGDSGASGCADPSAASATGPLSVNVLASTAYTTAVGGTEFNDMAAPSAYWSATNGAGFVSALSYIPETVWNESCAAGQAGCTQANLYAGGGGASAYFSKPSWQSGVAGIPADGKRDIPDVSLTAAGHDPYLLCMGGSCSGTSKSFYGIAGTSASAPSFAGLMALVDQKLHGRQGLANPTLYRLAAAEQWAQCNGSGATGLPAGGCIFNDVTAGNNAVPGGAGYGTASASYQAGAGYDLASGLGSVNAANLVNHWGSTTFSATATTLAISPVSIQAGSPASVSVTVAPKSGSGQPTGSVSLTSSTGGALGTLPLSNGAALGNVVFPAGSYTVTAHYSGDANYAPSDSAPVAVTVAGPVVSLSPVALHFGSQAIGASASQTVTLANTGSAPLTGIVIAAGGANAPDFSQTNNCPASLAAGSKCSITVTFKPAAAGVRSAVLTISDNAAAAPQTVALAGTGAGAPQVTLSAAGLSYGSVAVGAMSPFQTVTLSVTGSAPLSIRSIQLTGANAGDFTGTTNCMMVMQPGTSCTISLAFRPAAAGNRTASLVINDNAGSGVQPVGLSGTGVATTASRMR